MEDEYDKVRAENAWAAQQVPRCPDRLVGFFSFNPLKGYALGKLQHGLRLAAVSSALSSVFRYLRGLYQQSHAAHCKHNHIDGVVLISRLVQGCVRQRLLASSSRAVAERERVSENVALAESPEQYRAVASVFEQLRQQEQALAMQVHRVEQLVGKKGRCGCRSSGGFGSAGVAAEADLERYGFGQHRSVVASVAGGGKNSSRVVNRLGECRKAKATDDA